MLGLLSLSCVAVSASLLRLCDSNMCQPTFDQWTRRYNKQYSGPTERDYRESVYMSNLKMINVHNSGNSSWTMGVNKFADLTAAEFKGRFAMGFNHTIGEEVANVTYDVSAPPASVDWTTKGAVTAVKNQEQCGSCWAFSTTGSVEGAWFLKNGTLVSLSEQQLVDCSTAEGNEGCNGGLMDYGFEYIIKNKGITTEAAYPYTATGPNKCVAAGKPVAATLSGYKDVPVNSETALMTAIALTPVSVAVEADQSVFQFYTGGVMDSACGTALDHGVLAVGYGTEGGKDYYLVKNSWGGDWGVKGYIMLARGAKFNPAGQCGIQMAASYPVV
jgi:C1A family cysteine protease